MKYIILIFFVVLISCDRNYSPDYTDGFVELELNGVSEKLEAKAYKSETEESFDLYFYLRTKEEGFQRMVGSIEDINFSLDTNLLSHKFNEDLPYGSCLVTTGADGDLILDLYNVYDEESSITITSISENAELVKGFFSGVYKIDSSSQKVGVNNPDLYELKTAQFEVTIK